MPVDAPPAVRWSQKARQVQQAHFRATANKLVASFDYLVATGQLFKPWRLTGAFMPTLLEKRIPHHQ